MFIKAMRFMTLCATIRFQDTFGFAEGKYEETAAKFAWDAASCRLESTPSGRSFHVRARAPEFQRDFRAIGHNFRRKLSLIFHTFR